MENRIPKQKEQTMDKPLRLMPDRFLKGVTANRVMCALLINHESDVGDQLFGFYLPDFQRQSIWNQDQQIRFMESVWLELPIGSYIVNQTYLNHKYDGMLLDGQQRLRAIKAYLKDDFPVFGYKYWEITIVDKRRFNNLSFPCTQIEEEDINVLKDIYNRFNFGGTAHLPGEKAL